MNPGFELVEPRFNLEFEIYVQTLGFGNSMFEPGVLELYVRTLGSGTLCSNPGFWRTPCSNPGFGNSSPLPQRVRTLGSGTPCSNPRLGNSMLEPLGSGSPPSPTEFEPWVRELYVRTRALGNSMLEPRGLELPPPPPGSSNPGFGISMFRQTSKSS